MNKAIIEKLIKIQTTIQVEKTKHNNFGDFMFRSAEDILKALKPYLSELGLAILLSDELKSVDGKHYIEATATLTDGENEISTKASAREPGEPKPKMDASQTTGSTSSYARKYALSGLLGLDDGLDSDELNKKAPKGDKAAKLITKNQISELKKLGFDDERLNKMAAYYKVNTIEEVTYTQAEEAIKKQKKQVEKTAAGGV